MMQGRHGGYISVAAAISSGIRGGAVHSVVPVEPDGLVIQGVYDRDYVARSGRLYSGASYIRFKHSLQDWQRASWNVGRIPGFSVMHIGGDVNGT